MDFGPLRQVPPRRTRWVPSVVGVCSRGTCFQALEPTRLAVRQSFDAVHEMAIDEDSEVLWTCVAEMATELGPPMVPPNLVYFPLDDA